MDPPSEAPQGLDLGARVIAATQTKEFNGVYYVFQSALGAMAFADINPEETELSPDELRSVQCESMTELANVDLSQDLLEAVVEGPEVDAIYEIYAGEADEEGVDPEVYAEMDDIQFIE
jgi:hypothetical protein